MASSTAHRLRPPPQTEVDTFREGARVHDPFDSCPGCGAQCPHFASDFKAMGKKSIRVCLACKAVFLNEKRVSELEVHLIPEPVEP